MNTSGSDLPQVIFVLRHATGSAKEEKVGVGEETGGG